jgi:hypothetical protein
MLMNAHSHITLQSSYGDFDPAFRKRLPALEQAMLAQGLHPADFVIAKDLAQNPRLPIVYRPDGNPMEYTVLVKGRSFTVTQPDDMSFLRYFYRLCVPEVAKKDDPHSIAHTLHSEEKKLAAVIGRLERWLNKPI